MPNESSLCPHFVRGMISLMESYSRGVPPSAGNPFEGSSKTAVSIDAYMRRLFKYCEPAEEDIVLTVMLLDRLVYRYPECRLSESSFHRMFLISLVVAVKYRSDFYYTNTYYASVGGIGVAQLNELERAFLGMLDFDVSVSREEYDEFYAAVDKQFGLSGQGHLALIDFEQYPHDHTEDAVSQYSATSYDTTSSYHYQHTPHNVHGVQNTTSPPGNIWCSTSVVDSY